MKIAFLFPGQGSQFTGMGRSLAESSPLARQTFEEADDTLGFSLSTLCFDGPDEALKLTENTQPALVAASTAAWRVLADRGGAPDYVAGHSLGEYSALVAAGSLAFADALRLVRQRGQYMQAAVPAGVGAMAALLRLPPGTLEGILEAAAEGEVVAAANLNSPDQIVIAGHAGAVARAMELAKAAGAKRAIPLPVSAPFHCSLMAPAQLQMKAHLDQATFHHLNVPLVNNWQAREITSAGDAREGLYQQIPNPVRWEQTVRYLAVQGVTRAFEVGPGAVLMGLVRNISPDIVTVRAGEADDINVIAFPT